MAWKSEDSHVELLQSQVHIPIPQRNLGPYPNFFFKKILFDSIMTLQGISLAKRIKHVYMGLAIWKIILTLLTKAKHLSQSKHLSTE